MKPTFSQNVRMFVWWHLGTFGCLPVIILDCLLFPFKPWPSSRFPPLTDAAIRWCFAHWLAANPNRHLFKEDP